MKIPYFHVNAFTDHVFGGNPAGVCLLESWTEDTLLQRIAAENNLPETAFVVPGEKTVALRWFSPLMEIDLCGHATLAAAFILDTTGNTADRPIHFATRSGILTVDKQNDLFIMDFPARPAAAADFPETLVRGLGTAPGAVYKARDYLCVFEGEDQVAALSPDFSALAELDCLGVIATAAGREVDFVSRFFAPRAGIPEDPVTGSSHCTLIPYWAERTGKDRFVARQLSPRGGLLYCAHHGARVRIGGKAVLYHFATIVL
ncbi:MAG TPA: PhzF family phenazine biosynthesis protein [Desulfobacteraceae bacterium]|nr:PhzF family phenazine biosynthesis protein [Desulfobacteraceae bacterium]